MSENNNQNNNNNANNNNAVKAVDVKNRHYILNDNVTNITVKDVKLAILEINRYDAEQEAKDSTYVRKPIEIVVNTYGGSIYDGLGLVNAIDSSLTPVHTYCYGKAMSMGFIIFVVGHKRFAHPACSFMYHDGFTGVQGTGEQLRRSSAQLDRIVGIGDKYITSLTNITQERLDKIKKDVGDWFLFGLEAYEVGMVDELIVSQRGRYKK